MNMFARFDENPAMTLQDVKETKRYGRTHGQTDGQQYTVYPTTNKVCGGYNYIIFIGYLKTGWGGGLKRIPFGSATEPAHPRSLTSTFVIRFL